MLHQLPKSFVDAIKSEHRMICAKAYQLESALHEATAQKWSLNMIQEVTNRLTDLEHCLHDHFEREEQGGFLDEAAANAPRVAVESAHLMRDHTEILARIREMIEHAKHNQATDALEWFPFAQSLRALLRQLLAHETQENALLRNAFNLDAEALQ